MATEVESLPRYILGVVAVSAALLAVVLGFVIQQDRDTSRYERLLSQYHLLTITSLSVIDRELVEVMAHHLEYQHQPAPVLSDPHTLLYEGHHGILGDHLQLIGRQQTLIREYHETAGNPEFVGALTRLENGLSDFRAVFQNESEQSHTQSNAEYKKRAMALNQARIALEQLKRLHIKRAKYISSTLTDRYEQNNWKTFWFVLSAFIVALLVAARIMQLVYRSIRRQKHSDAELQSHRENLERLVVARTSELEAANKELESYSYSIAHDLRAPLRSVIGFSQILKEEVGDKLDVDQIDSLDRIITAGKNMAELIDDILQLSRISRTELSIKSVDLSQLARDIAQQLQNLDPARDVTWRIEEGLTVEGDAQLLFLALYNLMDNAWKYSSNNPQASIALMAERQNGQAVFVLRDNGAGFDMRYGDKLFHPFQRLHRPEEYPGTGVGLASVQRIIQRHGGRIWADAQLGRGASFYFTLHQ